jgi:hypothetical protein
MKQLKKRRRSMVLSGGGETTTVLQHALDRIAYGDPAEGIRQGLRDASEGKVRAVRDFFDEFEATHDLSR